MKVYKWNDPDAPWRHDPLTQFVIFLALVCIVLNIVFLLTMIFHVGGQ